MNAESEFGAWVTTCAREVVGAHLNGSKDAQLAFHNEQLNTPCHVAPSLIFPLT